MKNKKTFIIYIYKQNRKEKVISNIQINTNKNKYKMKNIL